MNDDIYTSTDCERADDVLSHNLDLRCPFEHLTATCRVDELVVTLVATDDGWSEES